MGAQTWTPQKANNTEQRDSFILKQTHFNENDENTTALKYFD
jgi:hypothetical protein